MNVEIPDLEWWSLQTQFFKEDFIKRLKSHIERYGPSGDSRIDGLANCPRCGSPNYAMSRLSLSETQPRSDSPHYYGKHCYTCGYSFDPKKQKTKELTQIGDVDDLEEAYGDLYKEFDKEADEE